VLTGGGLWAREAGNSCPEGSRLRCEAVAIERPANTGTVILKGQAHVSGEAFEVRADSIKVTSAARPTAKGSLLMANGHVVLRLGDHELKLRNLVFETDPARD
jgi:hypothetical protein